MSLAPHRTRSFRARPSVLVSATALAAALAALPATAQTVQPSPGVTVDLGVLEDLGRQQTVPDLLFPGTRAPRSRLLVEPPSQQRPLLVPTPGMTPRSRMQVAPARPAARPMPPPYVSDVPPPATLGAPPQRPAPPGAHAVPPAPVPTPQPAIADRVPPPPAAEQPPAPTMPAVTETRPAPPPPAAEPTASEPQATTTAMPEAPEPPAAAAPQPTEERVAAVQPKASTSGGVLTLPFEDGKATLPRSAQDSLDGVAQRLAADAGLQAQVLAYAAAEPGNTSRARRLSLSRALAVRSYLMDKGVASTRIEVRALGDQSDGGSPDRVDVRVGGS